MMAKEVMTESVVTLNGYMSLREAARILAEADISGAPVLDNEGKLIGICTETDILREVGEAADQIHLVYPSVHTMGVLFELSKGEVEIREAFDEKADTIVSDVMTKNVLTCTPDTVLNEVARVFIEKGINRLPVVDEEGSVVGIVTRGDIVRAFSTREED